MASLQELINIKEIKEKYNLEYFIETGTGLGGTLDQVKVIDFKLIQSCEIDIKTFETLKKNFTDDNILLHCGSSNDMLPIMLQNINKPALFFLDAHFPGWGFSTHNMIDTQFSLSEILPLQTEFTILENWEHISGSVIVVDDLRIYKKNDYVCGDIEDLRIQLSNPQHEFLDNFLNNTHDKIESLIQHGCVYYFPKK